MWVTNTGVTGKWDMLDAHTGNYICRIANVTQSTRTLAGTTVTTGATGTSKMTTLEAYAITTLSILEPLQRPRHVSQIGTQAKLSGGTTNASGSKSIGNGDRTLKPRFDGNNGFSLNVSSPAVQGSIRQVVTDKYVIGGTTGNITNNVSFRTAGNLWALNLNPTKGPWDHCCRTSPLPPAGLGDDAYGGGGFGHDTAFGGLSATDGIF